MKQISVHCQEAKEATAGVPDCSWKGHEDIEHLRGARVIARTHVEHTGHTVVIDVTDREYIGPDNFN